MVKGSWQIPELPEKWKLKGILRESVAEMVGTLVLVMFGDAVIVNMTVYTSNVGDAGVLIINICYGLAVIMGCLFSAGVSGAHLNPAVTITLAIFSGFQWKKVIPYISSQILGAFFGACIVYLAYKDAIEAHCALENNDCDNNPFLIAGAFCTKPKDHVTIFGAIWSEFHGTATLVALILALGDKYNVGNIGKAGPWAVGVLVMAIGMAFGPNTGYAINPARDFGPRLFAAMMWGPRVFSESGNNVFKVYWPIPLFASTVGGVIGGFFYHFLIRAHHPSEELDIDTSNADLNESKQKRPSSKQSVTGDY